MSDTIPTKPTATRVELTETPATRGRWLNLKLLRTDAAVAVRTLLDVRRHAAASSDKAFWFKVEVICQRRLTDLYTLRALHRDKNHRTRWQVQGTAHTVDITEAGITERAAYRVMEAARLRKLGLMSRYQARPTEPVAAPNAAL